MKAGIFCLSAISLLGLVASQPHGRRRHMHKRAYTTKTVLATNAAPYVIVYVDQDGTPYTTSTVGQVAATEAPAEPAAKTHQKHKHQKSKTSTTSTQAALAKPSSDVPAAAAKGRSSGTSDSSSASGYGLSYSPYNADGSCKTQSQVNSDFAKINNYGLVRIYGTDCDQVSTVLAAAKPKGIKLMLGVYDINAVSDEISTIVDACKGSWDSIDTISIGNEVVNSGTASADAVVSAIGTARAALQGTGFSGNVVTVDTFVALIANPSLCDASDFAAANCHAFFDGGVAASGAGQFVADQAQNVKNACGKKVVITESGWPSQGTANGLAVPSLENQKTAVASLTSHLGEGELVLFTAFNDMWKTASADTFDAEQFWGILN